MLNISPATMTFVRVSNTLERSSLNLLGIGVLRTGLSAIYRTKNSAAQAAAAVIETVRTQLSAAAFDCSQTERTHLEHDASQHHMCPLRLG